MYLMRSARIWYLYFGVILMVFMCFMVNFGVWCPNENEQKLENLLARYRDQIKEKDKEVREAGDKLRTSEKKIQDLILNLEVRGKNNRVFDQSMPVIYAITPTYNRSEQKAELTRLSQTFLHLPNFHWIVIEDSALRTKLVTNFLNLCGLSYTHLNILTPKEVKLKLDDPNWLKPRGVLQRNMGLSWLRKNLNPEKQPGVVYFADDDNTYDLKIFAEMRQTQKVSVWPVGLVGSLRYESPVVKNGKVTGWFTYWKPDRPFAMDMAGFAVNLQLFFQYPEVEFSNYVKRGYQESTILSGMKITLDDLEPLADHCTKVLVWHTRTETPKLKNEDRLNRKFGHGSDPNVEV
ncbi:galactosylgalactosylxylosylprotein 3-beta-glucuronosyltransferase I-like [Haliotis rufescens]|uniref:galactosylgalactosylxylosylprotein 3-beta-glucuronosyltransferase I-like n=1 Tax=Haliotis rufescens TaxID=6454 RepID=UPI001EAFA4C0|nr:galactosylgalactosylxylosylprotein 3-beta-glucuronosyltransferase I-like [Haliotis rufescens]